VKYNRVRARWPHPIWERESRSQATGGQTARATVDCLAPMLRGRSALAGLAWVGLTLVAVVRQVCPAALTVESGASAVFRQARLVELAWADSNRADSNQAGSNQAAVVCPVARSADSAASVCFRLSNRPAWAGSD
jgi:hypothetical protein